MLRVRPVLAAFVTLALVAGSHAASPQLTRSASAFVRSQAGSAINWELWGPEIATRAKAENKPVYVYIGSFLSELSRSTTQQIFTQPDNIKYLNEHFVCVIADREEQPELAAYAQYYLQNVKQTSGWPTHLWLTPELGVYEGGGYLPLTEEWGKTSFSKQARAAGESWANDPATCRAQAKDALQLMAPAPAEKPTEISAAALDEKLTKAAAAWRETFDAAHGGFGASPKNPEPELLRFLLRRSPEDRELALKTLRAILASPLRDPIDGGFFRYATDAAWRVPYLQKTLADQARMALALLDAEGVAHEKAFGDAARDALNYALRLENSNGTFAAAEDATTDDRMAYYVWTEAEIDAALGSDSPAFKDAFGVRATGNVPADDDPGGKMAGKNFLYRATPPGDAASEKVLATSLENLRSVRAKKSMPLRDDHATAGAHGLLLAALITAQQQLKDRSFAVAGTKLAVVLQTHLVTPSLGEVRRLAGSTASASPSDYLILSHAFGLLASTPGKPTSLSGQLLERVNHYYLDAAEGRYFASSSTLPAGIPLRIPAGADVMSADALGLIANPPSEKAASIRDALAATLVEGVTPSGDVLLALQASK